MKRMKEKFTETEKAHEYLVIQNKTSYMHKSQEQKYQKAFLKNAPMPKGKYPNLTDMLAIASKTLINSNQKKSEIHPKKNPSRQKLASLTVSPSKDKKNQKKNLIEQKKVLERAKPEEKKDQRKKSEEKLQDIEKKEKSEKESETPKAEEPTNSAEREKNEKV